MGKFSWMTTKINKNQLVFQMNPATVPEQIEA